MGSSKGTINMRGKVYKTVALRVSEFRERCPAADGWALVTDILHADADRVVMRAEVRDPAGRVVAVGHAEEYRAASTINKTSAIENGETSAIGRALAALGLGGEEYASADEVLHAMQLQAQTASAPPPPRHRESDEPAPARSEGEAPRWSDAERAGFCAKLGEIGLDYDAVASWCESVGRPRPSAMERSTRAKLLQYLQTPAGKAAMGGE